MCAQEHPRRHHRQAQQGDQRGPCRSQDEGATCRPGSHDACAARPPTSASSSPTRPKSGARRSGPPISKPIDTANISSSFTYGAATKIARRRCEGNTKLPRRTFLNLAAGAAALPAVSRIARAQAYPSRPVRRAGQLRAPGGDDGHTLRGAPRAADHWRIRAGLRGQRSGGHRRAEGHASRDHPEAQHRDQCGPVRS